MKHTYSVCMDAVFAGCDLKSSLEAIAQLGIRNYEIWSWWDKDIDLLKRETERLNLQITAMCTKFISLVNSAERHAYIQALSETIQIAKQLQCTTIITQVGHELPRLSRSLQHYNIVTGLKACVPLLQAAGITLVIEPLNTLVDHPGYFLWSSDEAFEIVGKVNSPHVKVLFDIYHQQVMEGHLAQRIQQNIQHIGHFHAAGNPGRNELDYGEIHYPNLLRSIHSTGYKGYIGLEYIPLDDPLEGLKRLIINDPVNS